MNIFEGSLLFIVHNPHLLYQLSLDQLALSGAAVGAAIAISLPVGVLVGHLHRYAFIAVSGSNIARALPSLAIIAIMLTFVGIGFPNIMIALLILAVPPILLNSYVGVEGIDPAMVSAARGMGMRSHQILFRVELPNAVPLILGGIRTGVVFVIATAYLGALAGDGSTLGTIITTDRPVYGLAGVLGATIVIVVLAFAAEAILAGIQHLLTPKGLRIATHLKPETTTEPMPDLVAA